MRQVQWSTLVKASDKDRNKPEPTYQFTGTSNKGDYQRTFYQPINYNPYTGQTE